MFGSLFSGLSKAAKFLFLTGFVIAILLIFFFSNLFSTNKYDVKIAQEATNNKATVDVTKKMELEMELKKLQLDREVVDRNAIEKLRAEREVVDRNAIEQLRADREIIDQNKKMELEFQREKAKEAKAQAAAKAKAANAAAAAKARAAKEKAEIDLLKSLAN